MADSSVLLEVIVEGKNIKLVQRDIEELGSSINKSSMATEKDTKQKKKNKKATDDLGAGVRNYNKGQKGVAQATANGTKAFSKQREAIGGGSSGLVGAYATIAANLFAATAAFGALRRAAQVETLIEGVTALGAASGQNIPLLAESLKEATGAAISLDQALRTASFASSSGFDASQIEQLAEVGRKAAVALGRDVGDAVDRLTRGVAKLEPEILDELGIIVRLDDATAAYAAQIGKTVNQLTAFERQQAFANATIEQGLSKFGDIDVDPNPYDKLAASLQDIANTGLALVNTFLGPLVSVFAENKLALASFVLVLTKGIAGQAAASFGTLSKSASDAAQRTAKEAKDAAKAQKNAFKDSRKALKMIPEELSKVAREYAELPKQAKSYDDLIEQEKALAKTIEKRERALNNANRTPAGIAKSKKEIAELTDLQGRLNAEIGKSKAPRLDPAIADTLANIKGQEANIFQSLDDDPSFGNFKDKFKEAKTLGNEYADTLRKSGKANFDFLKGIPFIGKGLGGVSKGLTAATLGFARFGIAGKVAIRGIVFAVPIIGQLLLGISLAFEALKKAAGVISDLLPKATKLEQTQRAVQASTQTLKDTTKAYEESLVSNTMATVEYLSVLSETASEEEKLEMAQKLRTEAIRAQITFIEGQGTAFSDLVTRLKEYDKAQKLATANAGIFGKAVLSVQEFGANLAFRFTRAFTLIGQSFRQLFQSFEDTIADFATNGEGELSFLAKIFGITEAEIAGTRAQSALLEKQLARTFKPVEDAVFADAGTEAQRAFVTAFEASEQSARELTDTILGVGQDIDTAAISNAFKTAFADVDAEGLSEAVRKAAQAADVDGSGALETEAEKRALIVSLLEQGTEKARDLADESKNISSSIDGAKENLSNFITGLSATKSSVSSIIGEVGILTSNLTESGLSGEILQEKIKELPTAFKELLGLQEMSGKEAVAAIKNFNILINRINLLEQAEKRRLNTIRATNAGLKTAGKLNLQAYEAIIANETKANQIQKDRIDGQIKLAELEVQRQEKAADGNITPELIAAQQKLFDLETQRESLSVGILDAEQQKLEVDLRRLDAAKEAVALGQEIAKNSAKELENKQKLENALSGRGATLTEGQQITAQIEAARVAVTAAETEKALAESRLAIEKQILEAKLNALNAQITTSNQGLPEAEQQAQIDVPGILQGFQDNTDMTLATFQAKIDGAKANLQGTLIDAAFGGREGSDNPVTAFVDNFEASLTRAGAALNAIGGDEASPFDKLKVQIQAARDVAKPFFDQLRAMGPDGELALAVSEGAFTIADSLTAITDSSATASEKLQAVGAAVGAIGNILQASANSRVSAIDKEIAAEKKRDGKSKESVARIQQLEKKKDAIKKKAFEQNKKIQIAQAIIGAAAAFAQAPVIAAQAASVAGPAAPAVFAATLAQTKAMILATTALQIAAIASTSYSGGGSAPNSGGSGGAPSSISVGERKSTVDLSKSQSASGELGYLRGQSGVGGPENFRPAFMGAQYRAMGGATTGYVVGEQGPELFVPSTPGTIVPEPETGLGTPVNATFNINTIDASGVEEVLTAQRGNIIGMLRDSANSYGDAFLEEVDTSIYSDTTGGMARA